MSDSIATSNINIDAAIATTIANCNGAANLASSSPYADIADWLVTASPVEVNSKMYALQLGMLTGTAWDLAKTAITKALKVRGYAWQSAGPHFAKRELKKVPFVLGLKSDLDAKKKTEAADAETLASELDRQAREASAQRKLETDRETTEQNLIDGVLSECDRLGLDRLKLINTLIASVYGDAVTTISCDRLAMLTALETASKPTRAKPAKA